MLKLMAIHVPCHTKGHMMYFLHPPSGGNPALFTGDTLFVGGCGKFFEGTAHDMCEALLHKVTHYPPQTRIYCGHEYAVTNLEFALTVEPDNEKTQEKLKWAKAQREKNLPTIPSTLEEELTYNPFLRVNERGLRNRLMALEDEEAEVMQILREKKNRFK
eukprot:GHVU01102993.1.p3 GENE.GHVU01102993.1~~GHVU01102993.1.p3  ORF type:complete len:160 (-),score=33.05 GHVU01102993.1:788-1267(-)